jgi:hypothetical protein
MNIRFCTEPGCQNQVIRQFPNERRKCAEHQQDFIKEALERTIKMHSRAAVRAESNSAATKRATALGGSEHES